MAAKDYIAQRRQWNIDHGYPVDAPATYGSTGGPGFIRDVSQAVTDYVAPVAKPLEQAVTSAVSDVSKALSTDDAKKAMAIAAAYYLPGVGSALGQTLVNQGLITGAAAQYATAIGTALAQTGASVAQGVPFDTALTNATVNAVTSTGSQSVAGYISKLGASPEVANAITSVGASGLSTAAKGGSAADIEKNMTGALAGSTITSMTGDKIAGAAVGGQITGGTTGALLGAAGAAGAADVKKTNTDTTTSVSGVDPGVQVAGGDDASAINLAMVSAKPEMLGKEGETSSQISSSTDNEGITTYRRSITGTSPDGKPYGYVVTYDPGAPQGKQISYETGYVAGPDGNLVDPSGGAGVSVAFKRPDFTATDTSKTGGTVAGEGLVIASDKTATGGGSSVSPADQKVLDLIKPTPTAGQATSAVDAPPIARPTGAVPNIPTRPTNQPVIDNFPGPTLTQPVATPGQVTSATPATFTPARAPGTVPETPTRPANQPVVDTFDFPKVTPADQAVIDLTGIGGGNVGGNVVVGPGTGLGAGNATGNVVIADVGAGTGTGNAAGNVVISDGGLGGGGNAAGNVIVGPGAGTGGPGGNVTIDAGGGGDGNAAANVSGNVAITEDKPVVDDKKVVDDNTKDDTKDDIVDDTYTPDVFIYGGVSPKTKTRTTTNLGTTLQAPFYPTSTLGQALTGYRGAGEIEGKKTGKPRKNVWNEESLRLKDALGL